MTLKLALILGLGSTGLGATTGGLPALAHGVVLNHRQVDSVEVQAIFESGEPMAGAQVVVYAPDSPQEAWQQGTTDDQGRFNFVPDPAQPGNWEVMVRQAGHGSIITVPVAADPAAAPGSETAPADPEGAATAAGAGAPAANSVISPSTTLSPVQRGITIGSVIWGFIGTALFFARGKR
jgi:nickel transport protein